MMYEPAFEEAILLAYTSKTGSRTIFAHSKNHTALGETCSNTTQYPEKVFAERSAQ